MCERTGCATKIPSTRLAQTQHNHDDGATPPAQAVPSRRHHASTNLSIRNVRQQQERNASNREEGQHISSRAENPAAAAAAAQLRRVSPSVNDGESSDDVSILAEIEQRIRLSRTNIAGSDSS
jgi:hypothetical protein